MRTRPSPTRTDGCGWGGSCLVGNGNVERCNQTTGRGGSTSIRTALNRHRLVEESDTARQLGVLAFYVRWGGLGFIGAVLASPKAGKLRKEQFVRLLKSCTRSRQNTLELEVVYDDGPRISEWSGKTLVPGAV